MFHWQTYRFGNNLGAIYHFPKRGDGIPMHNHIIEEVHNLIVLQGKCQVYGLNKEWSEIINQGEIYHFAENHYPHEIVALEDNCTILNLCVHGDKFDHIRDYGNHGDYGTDQTDVTIKLENDPIL